MLHEGNYAVWWREANACACEQLAQGGSGTRTLSGWKLNSRSHVQRSNQCHHQHHEPHTRSQMPRIPVLYKQQKVSASTGSPPIATIPTSTSDPSVSRTQHREGTTHRHVASSTTSSAASHRPPLPDRTKHRQPVDCSILWTAKIWTRATIVGCVWIWFRLIETWATRNWATFHVLMANFRPKRLVTPHRRHGLLRTHHHRMHYINPTINDAKRPCPLHHRVPKNEPPPPKVYCQNDDNNWKLYDISFKT